MSDKSKTACFSGHRILPTNCDTLQENLEKAIVSLINQGVVFFDAGGALGFDMLAEETILKLKSRYPQIKLILVLPCPPQEQTKKWTTEQKNRYFCIYAKADKVYITSPQYINGCMLKRNRQMINNSTHLICYLREQRGGTYYTVHYAEKQGTNILRL